MTIITGRDAVEDARILTLRAMLRMETRGLKRRGKSAYAIVKDEFGFKGSKQRVLAQLNEWIDTNIWKEGS